MSDFRQQLEPSKRVELMDGIKEKISSVEPFLDIASTQTSLKMEEIKEKRDKARLDLQKERSSIRARQTWLFYEALYRDAKYGTRGRGWIRQQAWDGLMEECYSGARTAVNSGIA